MLTLVSLLNYSRYYRYDDGEAFDDHSALDHLNLKLGIYRYRYLSLGFN